VPKTPDRYENYYQKGIVSIDQKDWTMAAAYLVTLEGIKYKDAKQLYNYANAQKSYSEGNLMMAKYYLGAINSSYSGYCSTEIAQLKETIKNEYPEFEAKKAKQEAELKAKAKTEGVSIGMSQEQVRNSNWGNPKSVNRTTGSYGTHEQWVYGGNNYLYFDNGILTTIQN